MNTPGVMSAAGPATAATPMRASIDLAVFFARTVRRAIVRRLVRHPLDPLPIVRARRALQ